MVHSMLRFRHLLSATCLASCAVAVGAQYPSQGYPSQGYPSTGYSQFAPMSDADQLAQQLRILAADPTNLYALVNAGNLSLKLGDTDGAAALFTRAEKVAPANPQVKAGMARLLVNAQRPGEALRLFQEAASLGASERDFGSDRALAYDLIGQQDRAQREYRSILRRVTDDETTRRYALSLGISGLKDPALALLDPLNRRSDRGAWRVRAFVLAMNGDRAGAERIATTMMPPGMADGLRPFFDRLPRLSAVDRAFAVHFGEVRPNATRVADARRVPALPALAPEPNPFPPVAATVQVAAADTGKKKSKRDKKLAAAVAARTPYVAPLPPPPAPTAAQLASLGSTRLPAPADAYGFGAQPRRATVLPPPPDAYRPAPTQLAQATLPPAAGRITAAPAPVPDESGDEGPDEVLPVTTRAPATQPATPPVRLATNALTPPTSAPAANPAIVPSPVAPTFSGALTPGFAASTPVPQAPPPAVPATQLAAVAPNVINPAPAISATPTVAPATAIPDPAPAAVVPAAQPAMSTSGPALVVPPPVGAEGDAVLAAIVANIKVPESELAPTATASAPQGALLSNIEKRADPTVKAALASTAPARERAGVKPSLTAADLRKDARGRFLDAQGRPLLTGKGVPMDAKAAIAWLTTRDPAYAAKLAKADEDETPALPKKNARGQFVDARGRPLLDARGRPMTEKAAAAWAAAQDKVADATPAKGKADALPKKNARGQFVDAKGKPLLDARGRPMDAKQAAAWLAAGGKPQADKKDMPEKAEPARIWVQVAGGANEDMLAKEWARVQGQSAALKGKQGWTTPLRATNRVLTGPFKTSAEAMALVNQLKKQGVSAFMFTSGAGQKVARLGAK